MTLVRVVAELDSIAVIPGGMFGLDAPLAWGFVERAKARHDRLPPITGTFAPDFPLPLARWGVDPWVWCTSRAHWEIVQEVTLNVRRKPAVQAMARYSPDRKHHAGLGPYKARDTILAAVAATSVWWDVDATNMDDLADLLSYVTHLGPRRRNGQGHVSQWRIEPQEGDWRDRPLPDPQGTLTEAIRAPYWHHTRRARVAA